MSVLVWDADTTRFYETGAKKVALYIKGEQGYGTGIAWNGVTSISEKPSGAEETKLYADDIKYASLRSAEDFALSIEAYQYPPEFALCDGTASPVTGVYLGQQPRKTFGLAYVTTIGNDESTEKGYKIHVVYNCMASPSERSYQTINDSPSAISFSWEISTTPTTVTGYKNTAIITIDSTKFTSETLKAKLKAVEDKLFGTTSTDATLPTPDELLALLQ